MKIRTTAPVLMDTLASAPARGAAGRPTLLDRGDRHFSTPRSDHGPGYLMIGDAFAFIDPVS